MLLLKEILKSFDVTEIPVQFQLCVPVDETIILKSKTLEGNLFIDIYVIFRILFFSGIWK